MKIAVVGCGALGSYYGAKLCWVGHDVHFLLRSDYDVVKDHGVFIESSEKSFCAQPRCARTPGEIGPVDLVLIGLKSTANHILAETLPPLIGPGTVVLTLQNGLGNEDAVAQVVGKERTMGGVCFVCLNRVQPGRIVHKAHGAVIVGEFEGPATERTHEMARVIAEAGVQCTATDHLLRARWEKLVWNVPFNGLGVAGVAGFEAVISGTIRYGTTFQPCMATDALLSNRRWESLVRELMLEVITAARAQGIDVPQNAAEQQIERTRTMGAYKASTIIDYENGRELELDGLFLEPLRRAQNAGVLCPRLTALCSALTDLAGQSMPASRAVAG